MSLLAGVFVVLLALCALVAVRLHRRFAGWEPMDRWMASATPLAAWFFLLPWASAILRGPWFDWNDVRLARSAALLHGYRIYFGPAEDGPVIGTLHAPVSHLLYTAVAWIPDPTFAIVAGAVFSSLLLLGPVFWLHLPARTASPRARALSLCAFLACALAITVSSGTQFSSSMIHADAAALGLATLAAGVLYHSRDERAWRPLWVSALAAALSVWSKQTMAPLVVALPVFLLLADGPRRAWRYLLSLAVCGTAVSAVVAILLWPPDAMWFNIVTLAVHRPPSGPPGTRIALALSALKKDAMTGVVPVLFLALYAFSFGRSVPFRLRDTLAANRWLLFPLIGLFELPFMLKAMMTEGGGINQQSLVGHFLFLGASMSLYGCVNAKDGSVDRFQAMASRLFAAVMILLNLAPGAILALPHSMAEMRANPTQAAYEYIKRHPGKVYFTSTPLATLAAEGKLYHFDYALHDRETAGRPLTAQQFQSGLPPSFSAVAFPPDCGLSSQAFAKMLANFRLVRDPELPGWTVYERPRS